MSSGKNSGRKQARKFKFMQRDAPKLKASISLTNNEKYQSVRRDLKKQRLAFDLESFDYGGQQWITNSLMSAQSLI